MTSVVRIRRKNGVVVQDCDVYIGRPMYQGGWKLPGSKWANPFKVGKHGTIDEVLEQYEAYVRGREDLMGSLEKLRGKVLGCWCKDKPSDKCHGDILIKLLDEK